MAAIDREYTKRPFYGARRITHELRKVGEQVVNHKRVERLMRKMGLQAIYPKPRTSMPGQGHKVYPYLLRGLQVLHPNHVWSTDITYIPMRQGFLYLTAVIDWFSRYVLAWELSNTMEVAFCLSVLEEALTEGSPDIFNTDQGAQYTSPDFTGRLLLDGIQISMDGRGRALDNVFVERLWRSVKYEEVYLKEYADGQEAHAGLKAYFEFYNRERPHQALNNRTPYEVYKAGRILA